MYLCVFDSTGKILLHRNMRATVRELERARSDFAGADLVVGCQCVFTWHWIADFCEERYIPFVLGHALYMKAIHGAKSGIRTDITKRFADQLVSSSIQADITMLDVYHDILLKLEGQVLRQARHHHPSARICRSLSSSFARLLKCPHEPAGRRSAGTHKKIGNAHLKWAFSEAAVLFLRGNEEAQLLH